MPFLDFHHFHTTTVNRFVAFSASAQEGIAPSYMVIVVYYHIGEYLRRNRSVRNVHGLSVASPQHSA